jgi:hypothetical protein
MCKKGIVVKPIPLNEMNSHFQTDLIDKQSNADGIYKFILVYKDHLTQFVLLWSLETKRAELEYHLMDTFTTFSAPHILHSDNGQEFHNQIMEQLCSM